MHPATLLLPALLHLATAAPAPSQNSTPYIGLTAHFGTASSPCTPGPLSFNLKPPTTWLSSPPTSHCLPGTPGDIHNITCVTRRLTPLKADKGLDVSVGDMGRCDMWGYTEPNCKGKYWVAGRGGDGNGDGGKGNGTGQSWYWTEEEREAGPDLLDVRSWSIDCLK